MRAAMERSGGMGGLEDRPLGQAPRLKWSGRTAAKGGRAGVWRVCLHVSVAGIADLQGSVSLSAGGHTGGSVFP